MNKLKMLGKCINHYCVIGGIFLIILLLRMIFAPHILLFLSIITLIILINLFACDVPRNILHSDEMMRVRVKKIYRKKNNWMVLTDTGKRIRLIHHAAKPRTKKGAFIYVFRGFGGNYYGVPE